MGLGNGVGITSLTVYEMENNPNVGNHQRGIGF